MSEQIQEYDAKTISEEKVSVETTEIHEIMNESIEKIEEQIYHKQLINIEEISKIDDEYPLEFQIFCQEHDLKPPSIKTGNGKALVTMLTNPNYYWNRETCDAFVKKFEITTKDSIQLFNKHSQWGIQTSTERGKSYIQYPYKLSNKHKMRKNFKFDGTTEEKNAEIDKIKSTIKADYIDVDNKDWQLGHKNPGSIDNSSDNLVLQPPIQAKYRDNYVFIDTLTKFPLAPKLETMIEKKEVELTAEQIKNYKNLFDKLFASL